TAREARPRRGRLRDVPGGEVEIGGIALSRWPPGRYPAVISCGLAGGLGDGLPTGAVLIPDAVGLDRGELHPCDPALVALLRDAARRRGVEPSSEPLVTVDH